MRRSMPKEGGGDRRLIVAANALEIPQAEKDAIFAGNAKKLLRL